MRSEPLVTRPVAAWRKQWQPYFNIRLILILLLGATLSAAGAWWTFDESQADRQELINRASIQMRDEIGHRFDATAGSLSTLKNVLRINPRLSHADFTSVVAELALNPSYQGVKSLGFIQLRGEGYLVQFIEPLHGNASTPDLDTTSDATLKNSIQQAVDNDQTTLSRMPAAASASGPPELLLLAPVFARSMPLGSAGERRAALLGLLFARIAPEQLMTGIAATLPAGSDVELSTQPKADAGALLLYSAARQRAGASSAPKADARDYFQASQDLKLFDQVLRVRVRSPHSFTPSLLQFLPWLVALIGVWLTLALARFYWQGLVLRQQSMQKMDAVKAELSEKGELVAGIFEMSPLAIALCDLGGNFISSNPAFERLFGYNATEIKELDYWKLSPELDNSFEARLLSTSTHHFGPYEKPLLHKLGHLIPVALNGMRLSGANGEQYICFLLEDITERKQTLQKLAESQAFSICVLDSLSAHIAVLDDTGRILSVNEAWRQFGRDNGADAAAIHPIGLNYLAVSPTGPATADGISARISAGLQSVLAGRQNDFEIDYPCDSPTENHWFHMMVTRLLAPARGVVISHTDISKVKQAQIDQQNAEDMLRSAIETIGEAFALFDADDRLVLFNQQFKELHPLCADLIVVGNTFEQIMRAGAERGQFETPQGRIEEWIQEKLATHRQSASDGTQRLSDGKVLRIIERQTPEGYTVGVRSDITKLVRATEAANQATRAKSEFLATMSHEIRTPMNAVLGLLQLLALTELNSQQSEYITKTRQAAHSMLQLLNDILDISRLESDKTELELQPFALDDLMRELSTLLSTQLDDKQIELLFDIDPQIPKLLIGDVLRLKQVLFNLGNNAVKFTAQGDVTIQIRMLSLSPGQVMLSFSVQDTGIGIAPENQQSIFSAFLQADSSITRRFGGSGLGLSISRKLVELMGGQIELKSVLGQGSTFSVTVPLQTANRRSPQLNPDARALAEPVQVLLVEDHPQARELEQAMAQSLGWQTDAVSSGSQALALIKAREQAGQAPYQLILMDEEMGDMDGWQASQRVREASAGGPSPLIIMLATHPRQALSKRKEPELALLSGYLVKPITAGMLSEALASAHMGRRTLRKLPHAPGIKEKRLQGLRLLVVEDNPLNQRVMQELLRIEGAEVDLADNGEHGVAAIARAKPPFDAVLMDLQMPVMDGYSATRVIRNELLLTTLPIIALSANNSMNDRLACLAAGMTEHVGKPFDMAHLVDVLLHQTGRASTAHSTPPPAADAFEKSDSTPLLLLDQSVLERLSGNPGMLRELLQSYLGEISSAPEQLELKLTQGDFIGAAQLTHTLIGISGIVGARHLAAVARLTESRIKTSPTSTETPSLCADFREATTRTRSALLPVIESLSRSA